MLFKKIIKTLFVMAAIPLSMGLFNVDTISASSIPSDAKEWNGHCYYLFRVGENSSIGSEGIMWNDAKKHCEQLGGHLVTINSPEEQAMLEEWLPEDGVNMFYIGATAIEGNWQWITGESMGYNNILSNDWTGVVVNKSYASDYGCRMVYAPQYGWEWTWGGYTNVADMNGYICEWSNFLTLSNKRLQLNKGDSVYLTYTVTDALGQVLDVPASYKSSNISVAKVSSQGKIVAVAPGKAVITVKANGISNTCTVIVKPQKVSGIKAISKTKNSIQLKWKKQSNVSKYQILMYDKDLEEYTVVKSVKGKINSAIIKNLSKNKKYKFKIRAVLKSGAKNYYGDYSKVYTSKTAK